MANARVDLNYRVTIPDADARTLLTDPSQHQGLQRLLKFDQLGLAMRTKKAFSDFVEDPIHHLPCVKSLVCAFIPLHHRRNGYEKTRVCDLKFS